MGRKALTALELLIVIAIVGVIVLMFSPLIHSTREEGRRHKCAQNLRKITIGLHSYALEHSGRFPADLSDLFPKFVDDAKVFICPSDADASDIAEDGSDLDTASSYIYSRGYSVRDSLDAILVCDKNDIFGKDTNHRGKGGNVASLGGEVRWVDTADWVNPVDRE